jgi:hypothetical protein
MELRTGPSYTGNHSLYEKTPLKGKKPLSPEKANPLFDHYVNVDELLDRLHAPHQPLGWCGAKVIGSTPIFSTAIISRLP